MIADRPRTPLAIAQLFLREIRIEHTFFALPFAYTGAIFGAQGLPTFAQFAWITIAVLGARTAAMAANRYIDRDIDARNPRTARRAVPSGRLSPGVMLWATGIGLLLVLVAAIELNPLCVKLLPLAALAIVAYPFCKRFTWGVHFVLGAVDGFAPLGAFVAVTGTISAAAVALFLAVTVWVAGFDIIYALMDRDVDLEQRLNSIPARFGEASGRALPLLLHLAMACILGFAGYLAEAGPVYYLGVAAAAGLVLYERSLFDRAENVFVLNERVFISNMIFSVVFLVTTAGGFLFR